MGITIEQTVESFTHPSLPKLQEQPLYHSLNELRKLLNATTASVPCTISTGDFGWIALTISPALYGTLAGAPFSFPVNPGHAPNIPNFATAMQIEAIWLEDKERMCLWNEYNTVDHALKQQLINAVDGKYICAYKNQLTEYAGIHTYQLIQHLRNTYGTL
jgi:hypothetical protein